MGNLAINQMSIKQIAVNHWNQSFFKVVYFLTVDNFISGERQQAQVQYPARIFKCKSVGYRLLNNLTKRLHITTLAPKIMIRL